MTDRIPSRSAGIVRVQVLSDLHAEMEPDRVPTPGEVDTDADIVIVAGDTAHARDAVPTALSMFPGAVTVVLVGGNHEHYGTGVDISQGLATMKASAAEHSLASGRTVLVLEDDEAVIDVRGVAVRILGCTMWTDYDLYGNAPADRQRVERALNDYRLIQGEAETGPLHGLPGTRLPVLTTGELLRRHHTSRDFLAAALRHPHDGPTITVTHHLPSMRSVSQRFRRDRVSAGFASRLDDLVDMGSTLWIHGHTHDSCLWRAPGGTLVACNPAGYALPGNLRENSKFLPRMVVDIRRGGPDNLWRAGQEETRRGS